MRDGWQQKSRFLKTLANKTNLYGQTPRRRSGKFCDWIQTKAEYLIFTTPSLTLTSYSAPSFSVCVKSKLRYLIFYCPLNLFYKCVAFLPVKLVLVALKEVVRTRKIAAGVHHAHHAYHHGYFIMVIVGYVKGSGVALISNFEQLLRGVWRPDTNEILNMSFPTKASLYGAILFTLQEAHWLPVAKSTLILVFTLFMATSKVVMTARHSHGSPFTLIESWVCHLLFGSPLGGSEEDHHHPPAAAVPSSPLKTKEELSEGARKRKVKKAE